MQPVKPVAGIKILIVEDEGIVARDIQRHLEQAGYMVCGIADNADEAIALALDKMPDLILMDIVIQGERDGIETAKEVRSRLDIPVVFLTAHSDEATLSRARESLPYGYLLKPFESRELITIIETARYRHGAEMRERVFRKALTAAGLGVAILDASTPQRILSWVNPALCAMSGHSEGELLGRTYPLLESMANREVLERDLDRAIAEGRDFTATLQVRRKDGSAFHDQLVLSAVRDGAGRIGHFIAIHQDVTAQREYEQTLEARVRERTSEMEHARIALEQAQEMTGLASWEYRMSTHELRASENLYAMHGISRDDLARDRNYLMNAIFPADIEARKKCNDDILAGREVRNFEFRIHDAKSQAVIWHSLSARPVFDAEGRLAGITGAVQDVTARKELEARLQRSLDELHSLLDASPIGIAFFRGGVIRSCNDAYFRILGWPVEELIGRGYGEVFQLRQAVNWDELVAEHAASPDKKSEREFEVRRKDGVWRWVRVMNASIDKNDVMGGTVVLCEDITQHRKLQQELNARLAQLDSIFSASPLGIALFSGETLMSCNKAYADLYGWLPEDMTGRPYADWWRPRGALPSREEMTLMVDSTGAPSRSLEEEIQLNDGRWRWVRSSSNRFYDPRAEHVEYSVVLNEDITERRQAENLRERLLAILENSLDFIAMADAEGRIDFLNRAARTMLGLGEDYRERGLMIDIAHPAWANELLMETALPTAAREGIWSGETALRHAQGFDIPVFQVIVAHRDGRGEVMHYSTVIHDLTERKRAESDLIIAKEAAERASRAKSEFLSSMSHELRTPMNAILGFAQLLQQDPVDRLTEGQKESVEQITAAGWHLLKLINDVLDLAKIEAGKFDVQLNPLNATEVVAETIHMMTTQAEARDVILENRLPDGWELSVQADRTRLLQVLANLVSNAIKYNRQGGRVVISARKEMSYVRLMVEDTGPGLSAIQQLALFQPFNRLGAEQSDVEGTGIGLVICKRLMEAMHGRIGVISMPGKGSTFWLELPVAALPSAGIDHPQADAEGFHVNLHEPLILYVEDNAANCTLMERVLDKLSGIRLVCARRGREGIEMARLHRPDLVLLDINLPDMSGLAVAQTLAADELTCDIPIVGLSANATPDDIDAARAVGIRTYFTKPIDISHLLQTVTRLMQARQKI